MSNPAAKYTLAVTIDPNEIPNLKAGGYKLCVARLVNGQYNVVWESRDISHTNEFRFSDDFQVFAIAGAAMPGASVVPFTHKIGITYGQTAILDGNGIMQTAQGMPDQSGKFRVLNRYGMLFFAVAAKTSAGVYDPIYVTTTPMLLGEVAFTPAQRVQIFFSNKYSTGMRFPSLVPDALEIRFGDGVTKVEAGHISNSNSPSGGRWVVFG